MKCKRIMIILVIAVFLFTIASASAGDVNDTVVASEDTGEIELSSNDGIAEDILQTTQKNNTLIRANNEEPVGEAADSEILGAGTGTYSDLRNDINNGEITKSLYRYVQGDGDSITITTNSRVIDGKGAVVDMAGVDVRALFVTANNVTIKNFTFKNTNVDFYSGGAIWLQSGSVENCIFINNNASSGGAVHLTDGNVINCTFINNTATNYGCAIDFSYDTNVINCTFINNSGAWYGGAICCGQNTKVINSNFTDNSATKSGGALYFSSYSNGEIVNCNFINNVAPEGGAVYASKYTPFKAINCNFTGNSATSNGGAVYTVQNSPAELTNCNFRDNSATNNGGAVYLSDEGNVSNCNFTNNQVSASYGYGGAVYFKNNGTVTNSNFVKNKANKYNGRGGAVYFNNNGTVTNSNFSENFACDDGSSVYFSGDGNVTDCNFVKDKVYLTGVVYFDNNGNVLNCNFVDNYVATSAIYFMHEGNATLCNFNNNRIYNDGMYGAITGKNEPVTADTCIFKTKYDLTRNTIILSPTLNVVDFTTVYKSGEKLAFDLRTNRGMPVSNGNISISIYNKTNGEWIGNYSCLSGEGWAVDLLPGSYYAIFNTEYYGFTPVNRSITVISNIREGTYSDLREDISNGNITKDVYRYVEGDGDSITITTNSKVIDGKGAIVDMAGSGIRALTVTASDVTIKNFTFKNANLNGDGAAIRMSSGSVVNCNFTDNNATASSGGGGGAVYFSGAGNVLNCNFVNNKLTGSATNGGALYFSGNGDVSNCNFVNNTQIGSRYGYGGAVCFNKNGIVTSCNFTDNSAPDGGAIYFLSSSVNQDVKDCNFINNSANNGGAVFSWNFCSVENSNFINNSALEYGGAICMDSGRVENCNFTNNSAYDGGAVEFEGNGDVVNSNFINNSASNGGAIYLKDDGNVTNCNFTDNFASYYSGAVYFYKKGIVTNCNFTNNSAKNIAGAVNFYKDGIVTNCNFADNTANRGGAIVFYNYAGIVTNSDFRGNTATSGSAIEFRFSTNSPRTVSNSRFLNNRANVHTKTPLNITVNENNIEIIFMGQNNLLNAINSDGDVSFTNVTYWGANGITNTGASPITPSRSNKEAGQNISVRLVVGNDVVLDEVKVTDENGMIVIDKPVEDYWITVRHEEDSYYTEAEKELNTRVGTYSDLREDISNGEITKILYRYVEGDGDTIEITNESIVIDGKGAVVDMAGSGIRALIVAARDVTIMNFTFKNAKISDDGGAIYSFNPSTGSYYVNIINCNFINNSATNYNSISIGNGGAIYMDYGEIINCSFVNNTASVWGGAIKAGRASVINCSFTNNKANGNSGWGGAIHTSTGTITNSSFTNNSANNGAGAVFFTASNVNGILRNCSFIDNFALTTGGAVYFYDGAIVSDSVFIGNNATTGSAIYTEGYSTNNRISNSIFLNNRANAETNSPLNLIVNENNIEIEFKGQNNFLNGIYSRYSANVFSLTNVTYWGANGITNTGASTIIPSRSNKEAGQNIYVGVVVDDEVLFNENMLTDDEGKIVLDVKVTGKYLINIRHDEDSYYTGAEKILTNMELNANVTSKNTNNKTVNITAESNLYVGKLLFILPNGDEVAATCDANGTWWAEYTFDDYDVYQVSALYIGLDNVTIIDGTVNITKANSTLIVEDIALSCDDSVNLTVITEGATGITAKLNGIEVVVVDNYTIPISDLPVGNHTLTVTTVPDEDHVSVTKTSAIIVDNLKLYINVTSVNTNNRTVNITAESNIYEGKLRFILSNGEEVNATNGTNGTWWAEFRFDDYGVYPVSAAYGGIHVVTVIDGVINITKANSTLIVEDVVLFIGESLNLTVTTEGATGVTANINGTDVVVDNYTIPISGLAVGNYTLTVTTIPDDDHVSVTKAASIIIHNLKYNVNVTSVNTNSRTVNITAESDIYEGRLRFILANGTEIDATNVANGTWWAEYTFDDYGVYQVSVAYDGLGDLTVNEGIINITKANSTLILEDVVLYLGESVNLTVTTEGATGITANINGTDVVVDNYTIPISGLAVGNYTLTVTTVPDGDHVSVTKTSSIIVKNLYLTVNVTSVDTHNRTVNITAKSNIYSGKLKFVLPDGKEVNATYATDGTWWAVHTFDYYGVYRVSAAYDGLGELTVNDGTVNITKANSTIMLENVELHVGESTDLTVETKGALGITAKINNDEVSVIDKFTIPIYNLTMGDYTLTVTTVPDAEHNAVTKTVKLTVGKYNTPLDIEIEFFNDTRKNVRIIAAVDPLTTGSIEFTVKDKTVSVPHNDEGIAVYELYLPVGEYTVNVNYPGDSMFNSKSKSESFTVKEPGKVDTSVIVIPFVEGNKVTIGLIVTEKDTTSVGEYIWGLLSGTGDNTIFETWFVDGVSTYALAEAGYGTPADVVNIIAGSLGAVVDGSVDTWDITTMAKGIASLWAGAYYGTAGSVGAVIAVDTVAWLFSDDDDSDIPKASGLATVEIDGIKYAVDIKDGEGMFTTTFAPGHYNAFAKYYGDEIYKPGTGSNTFDVVKPYKYNPKIVVVPTVNGTTVTLNITVSSNETSSVPSGNVTIGVLGQNFIVTLKNGTAVFTYDFNKGTYAADVTYLGNDKFNKATTNVSFTVQDIDIGLKNTTIGVDVEIIKKHVILTAYVDPLASGIIEFSLNGNTVYVPVKNGQAIFETNLGAGNYTADVTYLGDSRFNSNSTNASFEVNYVKLNPEIDAVVEVSGKTVSINISVGMSDLNETDLANATGQVRIGVSGQSFVVPVVDGNAVFTFDFASGIYDAEIEYLGDENFNGASTAVKFIVNDPYKTDTVVNATPVVKGTVVTINIAVGVDGNSSEDVQFNITGNVTVEVLNQTFSLPVVDGKAVFTYEFEPGIYEANIIYEGDENFNPALTTVEFETSDIIKFDADIGIVIDVNGTNVTFHITVGSNASDENATGELLIDILGQTFNVTLENGSAVFSSDFVPGTYGADVVYPGDKFFNNASTAVSFTVLDNAPDLMNTTLDVDVSAADNNVTITATVNQTASGIIEFNIGGNVVYLAVTNGKAIYNTVLPAGDYNVNVTYLGDSRFNGNRSSANFTVVDFIKKNTTIESDIKVDGSDVVINVVVDENATGLVEFIINNNSTYSKVVDGVATLNMVLHPGDYSVTANYLGDGNFNNASTTASFTVAEPVVELENTTLNVDVTAIENDVTITAKVDSLAGGLVEFNIDGNTVYIAVDNGEAVYEVALPGGDYNVTVTYLGDEKFNPNSTTKSFTVLDHVKKDTAVNCEVVVNGSEVSVTAAVNESSATGFVEFNIAGKTYYIPVDNGKAVFVADFLEGTYMGNARYVGDENFNPSMTLIYIDVAGEKITLENTTIDIDVDVYENNVTISANVSANATGFVEFVVTGAENYTLYILVEDGKAVFEDVLSVGDYTVTATYLGDDKFNSNATSESFTIVGHVKKDTVISAVPSVDGNTVTIETTVDENATGYVAISVLGQTFVVPVSDGKAVFTYDFTSGTYNSNVVYVGDDNFNNASTTASFTVTKHEVELKNTTISVDVNAVENDVTITAKVDSLASGLVEFNIDGQAVYIAVNNGEAVYTTNLPAGDYNVAVTYLGDDKFNPNSTAKSFTVLDHVKADTAVSCDVAVNGSEVSITAVVNESAATGFVEFNIMGKSYYAPVANGKAVFVADFLAGTYMGNARYLGDDNFNPSMSLIYINVAEENITLKNTTIDVDVEVYDSNVTISAIDNKFNGNATSESFTIAGHVRKDTVISAVPSVDGNTVTIEVTVDENATGYVAISVLGQTFVVPVSDGKAVFTYDFAPATYNSNVVYVGDDNFNNASTTASFTVIKQVVGLKNTTISVDVNAVENDVTITAKVDSLASGLVEFNINGNAVYIAVNNGEAVYEVVLPGGDYNVAVTYLGDDKFNPNSTSKSFTVSDHVKADTAVSCEVVVNGNEVSVTAVVNESAATGFVEFNIAGKTYYVPVANGKAIFVDDFLEGTYMGNARYIGDDNFNPSMSLIYINVAGENITLKNTTIDVNVDVYENNVTIIANVDSSATGFVEFVVTGAETISSTATLQASHSLLLAMSGRIL